MMSDQLHLEILPEKQKKAWQQLTAHHKHMKAGGFYLAGGTGLALQIGHRQSVDFDFFSQEKNIAKAARKWIDEISGWTYRDTDMNTIHGDLNNVKISFIGGYNYPTIDPLLITPEGIDIASIREIAAMKLLSITHRAVLRDYLDIAIIIRDHFPLEDILLLSQEKYGSSFNQLLPLRALVSFDDITGEYPFLFDENIKKDWQKTLRKAVKETV